jgi:hypothetical protein
MIGMGDVGSCAMSFDIVLTAPFSLTHSYLQISFPRIATAGMDFLHVDNVAGRTLLTLVARGSAVISELLRLSEHIPSIFLAGTGIAPHVSATTTAGGNALQSVPPLDAKHEKILLDFRYLKEPERYDSIIDNDLVSFFSILHTCIIHPFSIYILFVKSAQLHSSFSFLYL